MMKKNIKWSGRIMIIVLFLSLVIFFNFQSSPIITTQAASGSYTEDFTTITNMDGTNTNASGWGTGKIENSKKEPTLVGMISSSLIGNTLDVFVEGDYAYVTNQAGGLKVVNITDPTNPHINGTYDTFDIAQSVYVDGDFAYITDYHGDDFWVNFHVVNVTEPTNPTSAGTCSTFYYARDVVVKGEYAYVANDNNGLSVIDISDPTTPSQVHISDTDGTAVKITIVDDYAYIADGANGLVIADVTDPLFPTIVAEYLTGISSAVSVFVEGEYAYVVDIDNGLIILNISDPTTPTFLGSWGDVGATDAYIYEDYIYVANLNGGFSVVNISDPTTPEFIYFVSLPGYTQAIFVKGFYAYISCGDQGFRIFQIADISPIYSGSYNTPNSARDVHISGDFAYVTDYSGGLQVLDISDPSFPTYVGMYDTPGSARGVYVRGNYAFIADWSGGLQIIDISTPSSPTYVGSYAIFNAQNVFISGNYAYLVERFDGLYIIDISTPSSPTYVGSYNPPGTGQYLDVYVSGDLAYLANSDAGLVIVNVTNPSSPTFTSSYYTSGAAGVFVSKDCVYIASGYSGLYILNASDPTTPAFLGLYNTPDLACDVYVSGDYAFVADSQSGLQVINISISSSPSFIGHYDTPGFSDGVFVSGDYAYVADATSGLQIINMRNDRANLFDSPCVAQSSTIFTASSSTIVSATLIANDTIPTSTAITYHLSADNGMNWEVVTPGAEHVFTNTGDQLKWRAVLSTSDILETPLIYDLSINYTTTLDAPALLNPRDGYITEDYTPTFTWSGINGESNYLFQLDTTTSFTAPLLNLTLPSSSLSYTPSSSLAIGTYYWRVAGIDSNGEMGLFSSYRSITILLDTTNPVIDHPDDVSYELGQTGNDIIWHPTDTNPVRYVIIYDGIIQVDTGWNGGSITYNVDGQSVGILTATCYVYDADDNYILDSVTVTVSTPEPPTIDDITDFDYEEGTTGNSITWHPSDSNPYWFNVTRNGAVIDEGAWSGSDITVDIDGLSYGTYTYICSVYDLHGLSSSDTVILSVTDNVLPVVSEPINLEIEEGSTGNNIVWDASDNNPGTYIVYKDGILYETDTWTSSSSIIVYVDGLSAGEYNFTIVVSDIAGNLAKDSVILTVTPTVPEFNQSIFFAIISITVVFVFYYIKRRTHNRS
jgi:hypothetical protein